MKLKFSDFNIPLHGIFENQEEIAHYYETGIDQEMIISTYKAATAGSRSVIEQFTQLCANWFDFVDQLNQSATGRSFLFEHNELRLLADRLSDEQMGSLRISMKLHNYSPPSLRIRDRVERRIRRTKRKIVRGWYKHICGIHGPELDERLKDFQ